MKKQIQIFVLIILCGGFTQAANVVNFIQQAGMLLPQTKLDVDEQAIDAHDGEIRFYKDTYYLYGTSYQCGFEFEEASAPFCGFAVYTSKDMIAWKKQGLLFDVSSATWQNRCAHGSAGCYRPHMAFNKKNQNYVLWFNTNDPDTNAGYRVLTSKSPTGPFVETAQTPQLQVTNFPAGAKWRNGDGNIFVDDDQVAYVIYNAIQPLPPSNIKSRIVVEKLNDDYTSGTMKKGESVEVGTEDTEAPTMFKRNGIYYFAYQRGCAYCDGTQNGEERYASYKTALTPLGAFSQPNPLSTISCGGQMTHIVPLQNSKGTQYLFMSDLWTATPNQRNVMKNQATANYFWNWLDFAPDGTLATVNCAKEMPTNIAVSADAAKVVSGYSAWCDINQSVSRMQSFSPEKSGMLQELQITSFRRRTDAKKGEVPGEALVVSLFEGADPGQLKALGRYEIPAAQVSFAAQKISVMPKLQVDKNKKYFFQLSSAQNQRGCYGFLFSDANPNATGTEYYSQNGKKATQEVARDLFFRIKVQ